MSQAENILREATAWRLSSLEDPHAFDRYRDGMSGLFSVADVGSRSDAPFEHRVDARLIGPALITRSRSIPQTLVRDAPVIRSSGFDHVAIVLDLGRRTRSDYAGRALDTAAGDIRFIDLARPLSAHFDELHLVNLTAPRAALPPGLLGDDWHGQVLAGGSTQARLLAAQLMLLAEATDLSSGQADAAVRGVFHLAAASTSQAGSVSREALEGLRPALRTLAERHISDRLTQADLSPSSVAAGLGVSRPTLYRAFSDESGVWAYILGRRLDQAYALLAHSRSARGLIGDVAEAQGFVSAAYFSRTFRERFGVAPSDVAGSAAASSSRDLEPAGLVAWVKQTAAHRRTEAAHI